MSPRLTLWDRVNRWYWRLRCAVGIHNLTAMRARRSPDQAEVERMHPRDMPGRGDFRRCESCGARWRGGYDGIEGVWVREPPIPSRAPVKEADDAR